MLARFTALLAPLAVAVALLGMPTPANAAATWPVPSSVDTAKDVAAMSMSEFETHVMVEINQARADKGLRRISVFDRCTDRLAERWGRRIAVTDRFEHRNQNQVIRRCRASWAGETLVRGTGLTPERMVELWLDSPGHRAILLSPRARRAGVDVRRDASGRMIGVVNLVRHR